MLERIREGSQGLVAKSILVLVILTFALAGIGSYLGGSTEVAAVVVNGESISKAQFDNEFGKERANLERQYGEMFSLIANNPTYMESVRSNVLDRLIAQELTIQAASNMDLRVGDEEIKETIRNMEEFQVDGQFDNNRYLSLVRSAGYRVEQFKELLRVDLTRTQLINALISTDFVLDSEAQKIASLEQQLRDIRYIDIKVSDFVESATVTDAEVSDYYDVNSGQFTTQEQLSIQYLELKVSDLLSKVSVEEEKIVEQYNSYITQYQTPERRRVSHILFEFGEDEAAAKLKADAALVRVKAGEDFSVLAKELSDDTFSGEEGGDLDWMTNDNADDAFTTAVFGIGSDATSDLIRTDSGFHIVKITEFEASATTPLTEVHDEIKQELLTEAAKELYYELQQQLTDVAFSIPENLTEAALEIESSVKETTLFTRATVPASVNFPSVIEAAFSEQILGDNVNSEVIEITPDHLMVVRKKEYIPSVVKTLSDVKSEIVVTLKQQKAADMAKEKAQEFLAMWKNAEEIPGAVVVTKTDILRTNRDVDSAIVSAAFKLAKGDSKDIELVTTAQGQAIVDVTAVKEATDTSKEIGAVIQRLSATNGNATYAAFINSLKAKSDIQYPKS